MSRSTGSRKEKNASNKETKGLAPSDPIADAISSINDLVKSFIDSASEVQMYISQEGQSFQHLVMNNKEMFANLQNLCSRVTNSNNQHKNCQFLMKATEQWCQLMSDSPISSISTLDLKNRLSSSGRRLAASLLITGNIYPALSILKEVLEINEYDPHTSVILLRWLVRSNEWEAMERFLKHDRLKDKSNFVGLEDLVELCEDIKDFHRTPKNREEKAIKLMSTCNKLKEETNPTFSVYESQVLVYGALSLVSRVAGIKTINMMDPLYCIDLAFQKAETISKNRWPGFWFDKPLDALNTKTANSVEYLKIASSVAEYFDLLRINVSEYMRCGLHVQYSFIGLCNAIKLGFPVWMTETLMLYLSERIRMQSRNQEVTTVKKLIGCIFVKEDDENSKEKKEDENSGKEKEDVISDHLKKLFLVESPFPPPHIPSSTTPPCDCYLCLEYSFNPTFDFFCAKLSLMCSDYSIISSLESNYNLVRSKFAPFQWKLMNTSAAVKPRPPSWICDEMCQSIVSFLLSPTGLSLRMDDRDRMNLLSLGNKICAYSSQLCLPSRLMLKTLSRRARDNVSFPWMTSIATKSGTSVRDRETTSKEDEEEKVDYNSFKHLLYYDWRNRVCESLSLGSNDPWRKAMYLSETVAVASRQARRLLDGKIEPFGFKSVEEFKTAVARIPTDMTVNELIVTMSGDLILVKLHSRRTPIVVPLARESKWSILMDGISQAVTKGNESAKAGDIIVDPKSFWVERRKADEMMKRALMDIESDLLGAFAPLLLPSRKLTKKGETKAASLRKEMDKVVLSEDLAREIVSIAAQTTEDKFKPLVECMALLEGWSAHQKTRLLGLHKTRKPEEWIEFDLPVVFFVFSTEISRAPWEAISILEKKAYSSRLISIHQLFSLLHSSKNKVPLSANPLSAFYILDPDDNLALTRARLTPVVQKLPSWKGVTGAAPHKDQLGSIISQNDFFIYLGHGSGRSHMSRATFWRSRCKAVAILMGCSSAHIAHDGRGMDGKGTVLDYSVASCPCLVGCLFDVTDNEIDKYFTALVDEGFARHLKDEEDDDWLPSSELRTHLELMAKARTAVKLPYLTGAAVVSYGIPIDIRVNRT